MTMWVLSFNVCISGAHAKLMDKMKHYFALQIDESDIVKNWPTLICT